MGRPKGSKNKVKRERPFPIPGFVRNNLPVWKVGNDLPLWKVTEPPYKPLNTMPAPVVPKPKPEGYKIFIYTSSFNHSHIVSEPEDLEILDAFFAKIRKDAETAIKILSEFNNEEPTDNLEKANPTIN